MNNATRIALATIAVIALAIVTANAEVITPVDVGSAAGFQNIGPFFDAQPATTPIAGATADDFGSAGAFYENDGRAVYFDFGADWEKILIEEVWFGLKQWGPDPNGVEPEYLWSDDNSLGGDTSAPALNMYSWTAATSDKSWQRIFNGNVSLGNRYYIMSFDGTQDSGNRIQEIVFTGTVIPEPASALVLAMGALALLKRRR